MLGLCLIEDVVDVDAPPEKKQDRKKDSGPTMCITPHCGDRGIMMAKRW